jgi:hypothetical protein
LRSCQTPKLFDENGYSLCYIQNTLALRFWRQLLWLVLSSGIWRRVVWYKCTADPSVNYHSTRRHLPADSPLHMQISLVSLPCAQYDLQNQYSLATLRRLQDASENGKMWTLFRSALDWLCEKLLQYKETVTYRLPSIGVFYLHFRAKTR